MRAPASRPRVLAALLVLGAICAARAARASGEILVALDYDTDPALPGCPGVADFKRDVVRQLGRDPFRDVAPRRLVVRLSALGARVSGKVEWRDAHDEWEGERSFSSRNESCVQMERAMALATAIQIQLLARVEELAPPKPAGASKPTPPLEVAPIVIVSPAPTPTPTPTPTPREPWIAVDAGAGAIADFGDSPALLLPRLAVTLGRPSAFGVRLAVNGLGPGAQVTRPEGSAELDRFVMTLELIRFFRPQRRLQPFVAAGLGWQEVSARGTSAMPALAAGHVADAFTALVAAGGGLALVLAARLSLVVEAEAILFRPSVTVQIAAADAAHLDGVSLFIHGGILARF